MPSPVLTRVTVFGNLGMFFTSDRRLVLIDADMAPYVAARKWWVNKLGRVYTVETRIRADGKERGQAHSLHRRVAGFDVGEGEGIFTWFRGDSLDCRRSNLIIFDSHIF